MGERVLEYVVVAKPGEIDFGATGMTEIMQNVRTIVTTALGSVPLDRGFGVDQSDVDSPLMVAQARLTALIIEAVQINEPRVEVTGVSFDSDNLDGRLLPSIRVRLREGVEL